MLVLAFVALVPGAAEPADPSQGTVGPANPKVSWTGHFTGAANLDSSGALCWDSSRKPNPPQPSGQRACDVFSLTLDFEAASFPKMVGVDVALDGFRSPDDIDLVVYLRNPDGTVGPFVDDSTSFEVPERLTLHEPGSFYVFAVGYTVIDSDYMGTASFFSREAAGVGRGFEPHPISEPKYDIQAPGDDLDLQQHFVEAHDGVDLYVETWLPKTLKDNVPPGKIPTILLMTPYSGLDGYGLLASPYTMEYFVPRGYAFSFAHVRGTGKSGGCLEQTGKNQIDDGARIVEYLGRDAPWSDGNVGMFGISYDAETQISVAGLGDPEKTRYLKAIIPAASVGGQYEYSFFDGVPYMAWALGSNAFYGAVTAIPAQNSTPLQYVEKLECQDDVFVASADQSGDMTPFWQEREYRPGAPNVKAATLMVHGLADFNVLPITEAGFFDRLPASTPHKGLFGIWEHAFPDSHSVRPEWERADWLPMALAWYDRYLKGLPTGVESWPPVQVQGTDGQWRAEPDWPSTGGPVGQLAVGADGALGVSNPSGSTTYSEGAALVAEEPLSERAVFTLGPLKERLEITGQPVLDAWVSLDQPDAHFVAELETFDASGELIEAGIDWGMRSARHIEAIEDNHFRQAEGRPAPTNTPTRVSIRFLPTSLVIPKGGSLRLTISGLLTVARPLTVEGAGITGSTPSGAMTTVTILHDCEHPTALRFVMPRPNADLLRVRDARPADEKPVARPALSDGGGVASAPVCGKAPVRLDTFGPASSYSAPAPAGKPKTDPKPAPQKPKVEGKAALPATGIGDHRVAALAVIVIGVLCDRYRRGVRRVRS